MPNRDRTGPIGGGSMTGRGAGYCAGDDESDYPGFGLRRGFRRGFGRGGGGRGWGFRFRGAGLFGRAGLEDDPVTPPISREQEVITLKEQAQNLQDTLQHINDRLDKLENQE